MTGDDLADARFAHRPGPEYYTAATGIHSMLAVPMFRGDEPLGAMLVEAPEKNAFDEDDALLLDALAKQASIALANARLFEQLVRSREEVALRADSERTLREVAARITAIHDPAELLQGLLGEAARLLGAAAPRSTSSIRSRAWRSGSILPARPPRASRAARPTGGWPAGPSRRGTGSGPATTRGTVPSVTRAGPTPSSGAPASARSSPRRSSATTASSASSRSARDRAGVYGLLDAELLEGLASQAAVAITNARLIVELGRSREEIGRRAEAERALREIAAEVTALRDPREVAQLVIRAATTLLGGDVAEIGLADDADPLYAFVGATSLPVGEDAPPPRVLPGMGVSGLAYRERRVVRSGDYTRDARFRHGEGVDELLESHGLRSAISAPLVVEGRAFGAMTVISRPRDAFDEDDGDAAPGARRPGRDRGRQRPPHHRAGALRRRARPAGRDGAGAARHRRPHRPSLHDPDAVLDRIVDEARRLLGSDGAHLTLMADDGSYLVPVVVAGASDEASARLDADPGVPARRRDERARRLDSARRVWTEDYLVEPRIPHEPDDHEVADRLGIRGMAVAPLRAPGGEIIGTLAVSYRQPRSHRPTSWSCSRASPTMRRSPSATAASSNVSRAPRRATGSSSRTRRTSSSRPTRKVASRS